MNRIIRDVIYDTLTGEPIPFEISHIAVFGVTEKSGKTTLIQSMIKSSGRAALLFRTKRNEIGFEEARKIPTYFEDKGLTHWRTLEDLVSATLDRDVSRIPGVEYAIQQLCEGTDALSRVLERAKERLKEIKSEKRPNPWKEEIYGKLVAYLDEVIPQIQKLKASKVLSIEGPGIYVMDLVGLSDEMQALIIARCMEKIYHDLSNIVVVVPEASKFCPDDHGSPVKWAINRLVSEGRSSGNYVWADTQNLKGVDHKPFRNMDTRFFGRQPDGYEITETRKMMNVPRSQMPSNNEIMNLKRGFFYAKLDEGMPLVYARPIWLPDEVARRVAIGEISPMSSEVQAYNSVTLPKKDLGPALGPFLIYKEMNEMGFLAPDTSDIDKRLKKLEELVSSGERR